jgi:calcium-dependent protein kinase
MTSTTSIRKLYTFEKIIGTGGFGIVKLGKMKSNENKHVAIKIIEKLKLKNKQYLMLRELEVLK